MARRLICALGLLVAACGAATPEPAASSGITVFEGARLIDGTGGPVIDDAVVVVEGERLGVVGPRAAVTVPAGATRVDARGLTIVPGLINAHGHVGMTRGLVESRENYTAENIRAQLRQYARYGITTVMSLGLDFGPMSELQGPARAEEPPRATVLTAGRGFTGANGYPNVLQHLNGIPIEVDAVDEARMRVAELAESGVDVIKIWVDDHFGRYPTIRPDLSAAIIDAAHAQGLPVMAHVFYLDDAKRLVKAGVDGFAHNVRDREIDDELVQLLRDGSVFVAATLTREESTSMYAEPPAFLDDPFFTRWADAAVIAAIKAPSYGDAVRKHPDYQRHRDQFAMAKVNARRLHEAGVSLVLGTDTGPPGRFQGFFEHRELALLVEAGIPAADVLRLATLGSAEALGIAEDYGSLEPGKRADFILLEGDPLADIANTQRIRQVWIGGRPVD